MSLDRMRNVGIVAHVDAGKTTTTEQILYVCGHIRRPGSVDAGTTRTDFLPEERARGITIRAAAVALKWRDHAIHLIDTPGHTDFATEVQRALSVLDGAVLIVSAGDGVQHHTERLWHYLDDLKIPVLLLVNKMDQADGGPDGVLREIREALTPRAVPIQAPVGAGKGFQGVVDLVRGTRYLWTSGDALGIREEPAEPSREALIEAIAEVDEAIADHYLADTDVSPAALPAGLRRAVRGRGVVPVLYAAAARGMGIQPLLDSMVELLPPPPGPEEGPFAGRVFKVEHHPTLGRVAHVLVRSGVLRTRDVVRNGARGTEEKVTQIRSVQGGPGQAVPEAVAGEVAAVVGLASIRCGDVLGAEPARDVRALAEPVMVTRARLNGGGRRPDVLLAALQELEAEDPELRVRWSARHREVLVSVMGAVHVEFLQSAIRSRFGLEACFDRPTPEYLETIREACAGRCVYTGPLGDHNHHAEVRVRLDPLPRGSGVHWSSEVQDVPPPFLTEARAAVPEALLEAGPIRGSRLVDVAVRLTALGYTPISGVHDFHHAMCGAVRDALSQGGRPVMLEPILAFRCHAPVVHSAKVVGHLGAAGAVVQQVEHTETRAIVTGTIPGTASWEIPAQIGALTGGRGVWSAQLDHHRERDTPS